MNSYQAQLPACYNYDLVLDHTNTCTYWNAVRNVLSQRDFGNVQVVGRRAKFRSFQRIGSMTAIATAHWMKGMNWILVLAPDWMPDQMPDQGFEHGGKHNKTRRMTVA
jgi:hypothetical protein